MQCKPAGIALQIMQTQSLQCLTYLLDDIGKVYQAIGCTSCQGDHRLAGLDLFVFCMAVKQTALRLQKLQALTCLAFNDYVAVCTTKAKAADGNLTTIPGLSIIANLCACIAYLRNLRPWSHLGTMASAVCTWPNGPVALLQIAACPLGITLFHLGSCKGKQSW